MCGDNNMIKMEEKKNEGIKRSLSKDCDRMVY